MGDFSVNVFSNGEVKPDSMDAFANSYSSYSLNQAFFYTVRFVKEVFIKQYTFNVQGPDTVSVTTSATDFVGKVSNLTLYNQIVVSNNIRLLSTKITSLFCVTFIHIYVS